MEDDARPLRQGGVDAGRLIGAFLVILLHCLPNPAFQDHLPIPILLAGAVARVAVPFFFVASGLFLPVRHEPVVATTRRTIGRLLPLYLFWLFVYIVVFSTPLPSYPRPWKPSILWTGGPGFQLWFLPALGASQWVVATVAGRGGKGLAVAISLAIAGLGLWVVYGQSPHMPAPFWLARLCQGPLLVLAGHLIGHRHVRLELGPAAALTLLAYLLSLIEDSVIARMSGHPLTYGEFTLSTCLFGIAAVLLARAPGLAVPLPGWWQPARLSLLIYCVHVLFLWPLLHWIGTGPFGQTLLLFGCVSLLSLGAAVALLRLPRIRWITG